MTRMDNGCFLPFACGRGELGVPAREQDVDKVPPFSHGRKRRLGAVEILLFHLASPFFPG